MTSSRWVVNTEKAVKTRRPRTSARSRVTRPTIAPTEPLDAVSTSAGTTHCSAMPTRLAPKVISATKIARFKECIGPLALILHRRGSRDKRGKKYAAPKIAGR